MRYECQDRPERVTRVGTDVRTCGLHCVIESIREDFQLHTIAQLLPGCPFGIAYCAHWVQVNDTRTELI